MDPRADRIRMEDRTKEDSEDPRVARIRMEGRTKEEDSQADSIQTETPMDLEAAISQANSRYFSNF